MSDHEHRSTPPAHHHDCGTLFGRGDEKGTGIVRNDIQEAAPPASPWAVFSTWMRWIGNGWTPISACAAARAANYCAPAASSLCSFVSFVVSVAPAAMRY
jgi:hypothetical protein